MKAIIIVIPIIILTAIGSGYALYLSSSDENAIDLNIERQIGDVNTSLASPVLGSPSASVTIIEFGDYQCPNCKKWFLNTKPDIVTNYIDTGKVNLIFVDIAFLGKDSVPAARATYCAEEQGRYWDYHGFLYSNQIGIDSGWANIDSLKGYANNLGMNMDLFVSCIDSEKYEKRVQFNTDESVKNDVTGTPTFIIVGPQGQQERIIGPQPFSVFKNTIDALL